MRRPFRISSDAESPAARARFKARTSSSPRRTVVEISRAIHSPYNEGPRKAIGLWVPNRRSVQAVFIILKIHSLGFHCPIGTGRNNLTSASPTSAVSRRMIPRVAPCLALLSAMPFAGSHRPSLRPGCPRAGTVPTSDCSSPGERYQAAVGDGRALANDAGVKVEEGRRYEDLQF